MAGGRGFAGYAAEQRLHIRSRRVPGHDHDEHDHNKHEEDHEHDKYDEAQHESSYGFRGQYDLIDKDDCDDH